MWEIRRIPLITKFRTWINYKFNKLLLKKKKKKNKNNNNNKKKTTVLVLGPSSNVFFQLMLISWILSSCLIWDRSTYRRCRLWKKKIIFSDEAYFDLGGHVNKQNYRIWATENPHAYIEKLTHPKRVTSLVRILVQRHNWAIFLRKSARRGRYS